MNISTASHLIRCGHETGAAMEKSLFAILMATGFLTSAACANPTAAVLLSSTGKVLVNAGNGFQPAMPDSSLNMGFEVFVAENSSATVHFNAGNCNVLLASGSVTRITGASMCQEAASTRALPQGLRGLVDEVVVTPVNGYAAPPPPPMATGFLSPYAIAGGFLAVGAATITLSMLQHDPVAPAPATVP